MTTITIPKKLANRDDLVVIPRREYEKLLAFKKIKEFAPTAAEKKALARARKNFVKGNITTLKELKNELGLSNR